MHKISELEERALNEFYVYALEESRKLKNFEEVAKILDRVKLKVSKRLGDVV